MSKKSKNIYNNHFYIGYAGNKRTEMKNLLEMIDLTNISTVVDPFTGSSSIPYFISLKYHGLKYILNDNDIRLKEMYDLMKDDDKIIEFENEYARLVAHMISTDNSDEMKIKYKEIIKSDSLMSWFIGHKIYTIRPKLFPLNEIYRIKPTLSLKSFPIYEFFKNADITFSCDDGLTIYEQYKNDPEALIILDPPYMNCCNTFYSKQHNLNIYEYLCNNNISNEQAHIYLILEDIWITRLLFRDNIIVSKYPKVYQQQKKKTSHIIITNVNDTKENVDENIV